MLFTHIHRLSSPLVPIYIPPPQAAIAPEQCYVSDREGKGEEQRGHSDD